MKHLPLDETNVGLVDSLLMNAFTQLFYKGNYDEKSVGQLLKLAQDWKREGVLYAMNAKIAEAQALKQLLAAVVRLHQILDENISYTSDTVYELQAVLEEPSLVKLINLLNK